jgi:hypothetical protein
MEKKRVCSSNSMEKKIVYSSTNPLYPYNTNNQVILTFKYNLYKCRCMGYKPGVNVAPEILY